MKGFRYFDNVSTLCLNSRLCVGCKNCITVCPHNVFAAEKKRIKIVDDDACMECGACVTNCPAGAVFVRPGVGCAQAVLHGWLVKIPFMRRIFSPDSCCS
ncbi:MAG: 4Fe-4S dicluster domain-containing protein [Desulfonatronovibrio sp. MSAO_Bac4]|nr:MAG: 4Fe-4S dicluster domain-containing protein [Desulfonatronovibrio sp. MSAO_Bac4]